MKVLSHAEAAESGRVSAFLALAVAGGLSLWALLGGVPSGDEAGGSTDPEPSSRHRPASGQEAVEADAAAAPARIENASADASTSGDEDATPGSGAWWKDPEIVERVREAWRNLIEDRRARTRKNYEEMRLGSERLEEMLQWEEGRFGMLKIDPSLLGLPEWESNAVANAYGSLAEHVKSRHPLDARALDGPVAALFYLRRDPEKLLRLLWEDSPPEFSEEVRSRVQEAWVSAVARQVPLDMEDEVLGGAYLEAKKQVLGPGAESPPYFEKLRLFPEIDEVQKKIMQVNEEYLEDLRRIVAAEQARLAVAGEGE